MKVYLGSDHRGFSLKEKITQWLQKWGYDFEDLGANSFDPEDDYAFYAKKLAESVRASVDGKEETRGILLCGSGVGVDVTANKFDGVRASIGKSAAQVKAGREDDDMNVLAIASDYTKESEVKEMLKVFLETEFSNKPRYKKRLADIEEIEKNN